MGLLGKLFAKKAVQVKAEVKKIENRDLLEAVIGGGLLIAAVGGDGIDDKEQKTIDTLLRTNKNLAHFGSEITETINRFTTRINAGYRTARFEILDEIEDIKNDPKDARDVLLNMIEVADSSGGIDEAEMKELDFIANKLGLRLQDYV